MNNDKFHLQCITCGEKYPGNKIVYRCNCGSLLEVKIINPKFKIENNSKSGVWKFKGLFPHIEEKYIVSHPEGNTNLYEVGINSKKGTDKIGKYVNSNHLWLKHEGQNPTGSFKDRGMTVGISMAKNLNAKAVACASTGNTSSSLASYAALAGIPCFVFIPKGKISPAKISQSIAYGAINIQIEGDFDAAMELVEKVSLDFGIYLLNSINPFRIEGQKTILFELLQQRNWQIPGWIILPGGNLGNVSAIGKGLRELRKLGKIKKIPQIAVIQASGANPFYQSFKAKFTRQFKVKADTLASAIRIGNPVSFEKAKKVIQETNGVVEEVKDQEILDAKAVVDNSGIGCEPASASTVAGLKKLIQKKIIGRDDHVIGILTGHLLKDPQVTTNKIYEETEKTVEKLISKILRG